MKDITLNDLWKGLEGAAKKKDLLYSFKLVRELERRKTIENNKQTWGNDEET